MLWIVQLLIHGAVGHSDSLLDGHITTCVLQIIDSYIDEGFPVAVSLYRKSTSADSTRTRNLSQDNGGNNMANYDLLQNLHFRMKWQIVTSSPDADEEKYNTGLHEIYDKHKGYIIRAPNETGFLSRQLKSLRSYRNAWNSRARFVIISDEVLPDSGDTAKEILKELRHLNVYNVILLTPSRGGLRALDLYTWFPYQLPSGQCGNVKDVVVLDQWIMEGSGRFLRNVSLFPPKVPRNLGGCNMTASAVAQPPFVMSSDRNTNERNILKYDEGSDLRLFLFIAEAMNVSVMITASEDTIYVWPTKLQNGTWTSALGDIDNKKADIAFSDLLLNLDKLTSFDTTSIYYFSGLVWIIPCAKPFERWSSITRVFSMSMWLLLLISICVSAGFMYFLTKCHSNVVDEIGLYRTLLDCFSNVWAIHLGLSVAKMPTTGHLKIYFIMFVWYCIAINTVFQAFFTSYLVDPGYQKQISSVEDIIESGLEYGFYPGIGVLLPDNSDWRFKEILSHRIPCYDNSCVERAIEKNDFATISDSKFAEYLNTCGNNSKSTLCTFTQDSTTKPMAMYLEQGHLLTEYVSRLIDIAVEAGLYNFWFKNIMDTSRIKNAFIRSPILTDEYTLLLQTHLQSIYYIQGLSYCLSVTTFLGEMLHHKIWVKISPRNSREQLK
ncbi:hypothetical protein L798_02938 [Zootermopsis nevadensis]|uniref:Ionotropic glutamate receptor C-terminal domain-containing protein n=1 Tax=Zootermopsis nevadensis TaxID=136037 RepID=A0A067QR34_ZOONE|nr:hypothetical protein L798_02938 [Zootermopsis nevadensis]